MSRGLNQFEVGSVIDPEKVAGVSSTPPGNDKKLQTMLGDLQLRNRAQPLSYNMVTAVVRDVKSDASTDNTRYVVFKPRVDCILVSAEIHVRETYSTSATVTFPLVTVDGYLLASSSNIVTGTNKPLDPSPSAQTVSVIPPVTEQAVSANTSSGDGLPNGLLGLPIENDFFSANTFFVLRMKPPTYNGSSAEGWKLANVNLHFAEFHQS